MAWPPTVLETFLTEFYASRTTNERKREIEQILRSFMAQPDMWKQCLTMLTKTENKFVLMFCLTVFENVINCHWMKMAAPDRSDMRQSLYSYMLSKKDVPNFVNNKLGKLIVDIGRLEWPHFYPDFFINIHQLSQVPESAQLGIMLLQTAFEELAFPREDMSASRKEEVHKLLLEQVPTALNILCGHLESILNKHCHTVTATPPPSPTQTSDSSPSDMFDAHLNTGNLFSGFLKSKRKLCLEHMPPLDAESHHLCVACLKCLAHLLGWMPLSSYVTSSLLTIVFRYATFGCSHLSSIYIDADSENLETNADLGIHAMSCINEIMSRNCIPAEFEEFILQLFQDTFHLLEYLTNSSNGQSTLACINENFVEKFTEFLNLFVSMHLKRFEGNPNFPVLEFLKLLFKYSFQQPCHDGFNACLDIWNIFLDYLLTKMSIRVTEYSSVLNRYKEVLLALVHELFKRLQFRYNQSNLEELDDEELNDDAQTEWKSFLCQCMELTSKICDIIPVDVFNLVYSVFEENLQIYLSLANYVEGKNTSEKPVLLVVGEIECRRLHCSLRDLSSMLQGIGRLVEQMSGENYSERKEVAQKTLEKLCESASYSNINRFYNMITDAPLVLRTDFIEVHAQILATMKAFSHWLTQYGRETMQEKTATAPDVVTCSSIDQAIAEIIVANIAQEVPFKVVHSAAHLFMSITSTVRPAFLFTLPSLRKMFTSICEGELRNLHIETQLIVYRAISNMLSLPWAHRSDSQQQWGSRAHEHKLFLKALSSPLNVALTNPAFPLDKEQQERAKPGVLWGLHIFSDLIDSIADASTKTKQIFYESLEDPLIMVESLFHVYLTNSDVCESILNFYLSLFAVLKSQTGLVYIERIMETFINLFTVHERVESTLGEGATGCKVIEKLLQLLQCMVQEPPSITSNHLPSTIRLCMDRILPAVTVEGPYMEVAPLLFELLYTLLLHNWKFFFKGGVVISHSRGGDEILENEHEFIRIMEAFLKSFAQPDISLFRQNLAALEDLNSKWKLYHKAFFKNLMLNPFLNVLLQSLVNKSYGLLHEEISLCIYNMAFVDFHNFFSNFLPQFLCSVEQLDDSHRVLLLEDFKQDLDLPSFMQNTLRFVCDLRYYCISSNPH